MSDTQQSGNNGAPPASERRKYLILFILKFGLGLLLLILGGWAVKNTRGQRDTFGPPYFVGAFIVGCSFVLAGLVNILVYRRLFRKEGVPSQRELSQTVLGEVILTFVAVIGGFIGIFFVSLFGVPECDPGDFFSHCNYTKNLSENRSIAIAILIFLLASEIVAVGSIVVHCRTCRGNGPNNIFRQRAQGFTVQHHTYTAAGPTNPGNVVYSTSPEPHSYYGRSYAHGRNYDDFSGDTQVIIDGQVVDKGKGGFQGAVLSQPQTTTIMHPPVGYQQYSDQPAQHQRAGYEAQGTYPTTNAVNDLQEQNRLLREQIALQQQQLLIMQQQHQDRAPSPSVPPPPSYDSCMQDPVQVNLLQEQNKELQNRYQSQQQRLEKMLPPSDANIQPSAPPI